VRILFDQGTPVPLRQSLTQHEVATTYERGWSKLKNGELLDAAEDEDFAVLVTTDSNLKFQQNLQSRRIAIVVLTTPSWLRIQRAIGPVVRAIEGATKGSYIEIEIP
jgi:predicted nuclease of predicted toxin-antitoxin system